ncbi:hypothetical protein MRX96_021383 [Rhipicephalus microplus]
MTHLFSSRESKSEARRGEGSSYKSPEGSPTQILSLDDVSPLASSRFAQKTAKQSRRRRGKAKRRKYGGERQMATRHGEITVITAPGDMGRRIVQMKKAPKVCRTASATPSRLGCG